MALKMPQIQSCQASECAYNKEMKCHALAITVGDQLHTMCDTFIKAGRKGGVMDMTGSVGACKIEGCKFNDALECNAAPGIKMVAHEGHADCGTFAAR